MKAKVDASVLGTASRVVESNVVDVLLRTPLEELRLFSLAKLVETFLKSWMQRWIWDKRTWDVSLASSLVRMTKGIQNKRRYNKSTRTKAQ